MAASITWPQWKEKLAAVFKEKTRDEWCAILEGTDVCFAPVLTMGEAPDHPHSRHRAAFVEGSGGWQPNAAPRFSRTPSAIRSAPAAAGAHTREGLSGWGIETGEIDALIGSGVVAQRAATRS